MADNAYPCARGVRSWPKVAVDVARDPEGLLIDAPDNEKLNTVDYGDGRDECRRKE